ncbi:MAG: metallophosphoesterase [Ignavibacteriaceae bacterium]
MKKLSCLFFSFLLLTCTQSEAQTFDNEIKFCVISDVHLYDTTLGINGAAFQFALMQDRKMLAESQEILKSAISIIKAEDPDFVLIPGDLTMNGEKHNHELLQSYLSELKSDGIPSYVVPGNHDISNPAAYRYEGDSVFSIPTVTPQEFVQIYNDFGFSEALLRDSSSLSYIAEPVEGIQIFALDACRYNEQTSNMITGGKFSAPTLEWIKENLIKAKNENKIVIGMMHHGILEHYEGQKAFFPNFIVEGHDTVSAMFAENGMKLVFTGHYHAQDIVHKKFNDSSEIYDVETASLVSSPNPVRVVTISPGKSMEIETRIITEINYPTGGMSFTEYAKKFSDDKLKVIVPYILTTSASEWGVSLSDFEAAFVAPYLIDALSAHYAGDEMPSQETRQFLDFLLSSDNAGFNFLGNALNGVWTDPAPSDNFYIIDNISVVSVESEASSAIVTGFKLEQNYPNPFNPVTNLKYSLPENGLVKLKVYDLIGREVITLVNEEKEAGEHSIQFNASALATGVYYYKLEYGNSILSRSMVLLK